ncbi:MAG: hypothetical protein II030_00850, partial [Treponema sp.]|nr:hypothetical protein [Treponema sp.]
INFYTSSSIDNSNKVRTEIKCKNGDSYSTSMETVLDEVGGAGVSYYYPLDDCFFEPGFTYTITIYVYGADGEMGDLYGTYTTSAKATKDGIVFTVN